MRRRIAVVIGTAALLLAAVSVGSARAADECNGLRVCLPVAGPWVLVPASGVDYELSCPLAGYIVAGVDARVVAGDVDVSFRGEPGSPVGPGVTTRRSVVFHAVRTTEGARTTSFQPFIGCIPTSGGGGRALTGVSARTAGIKPTQPMSSVVVNRRLRGRSVTVRARCPAGTRLVAATDAVAFRQPAPPSPTQLGSIRVRRSTVGDVVVARVTAAEAAGAFAEVQIRAVCARSR